MTSLPTIMPDRMTKLFVYAHLPQELQHHSHPFFELAQPIVETVSPGPERTVGFRKLLDAKDVIVHPVVIPE
jgi:hypothetical protein